MSKSPKIKLLGAILVLAGLAYDAFTEYVRDKDIEEKINDKFDEKIDKLVDKAVTKRLKEKGGA